MHVFYKYLDIACIALKLSLEFTVCSYKQTNMHTQGAVHPARMGQVSPNSSLQIA